MQQTNSPAVPPARGHLIVGQSGGATAVINASLVGVIRTALASDRIDGVYGMRYGVRGALTRDLVDLRALPADVLDAVSQTPSSALGSCRYRLSQDEAYQAVENLRGLGVRYVAYIGGNDSADTAIKLAEAAIAADYDLRVICVPKTIDNDLPETDHCPGYGSAARFLALATMDSALCTLSMPDHYPVKIIEVMGRDAGWLVAACALGKRREEDAPHLLYLPERALSERQFLEDVRVAYERYGYVVAAVAETVRDEYGRPLGEMGAQGSDAFGHKLLGGAAQYLVDLVRRELGMRARFDKPGDLQRMSSATVSPVDRAEAEMVGRAAVTSLLRGETGQMVTLERRPGDTYACDVGLTSLVHVANRHRPLPSEFITPDGRGVTEAFRAYALPLLGGELPQYPQLIRVK